MNDENEKIAYYEKWWKVLEAIAEIYCLTNDTELSMYAQKIDLDETDIYYTLKGLENAGVLKLIDWQSEDEKTTRLMDGAYFSIVINPQEFLSCTLESKRSLLVYQKELKEKNEKKKAIKISFKNGSLYCNEYFYRPKSQINKAIIQALKDKNNKELNEGFYSKVPYNYILSLLRQLEGLGGVTEIQLERAIYSINKELKKKKIRINLGKVSKEKHIFAEYQ